MTRQNKSADYIKHKISLIGLINIRKKIYPNEFKESDDKLISQLNSEDFNLDERLLEYLYFYLFTHKELLASSEIRYNSSNGTFTILSVEHTEESISKIRGKIEQLSITKDNLMPIKKETSIFEKLGEKYITWKETAFATNSAFELTKLYTDPIVVGKELNVAEVSTILNKQPYSEMHYRRILDSGIIHKMKDGQITRYYSSPSDNIVDIDKDNLEEITDEEVNSKNDDFWKECEYHLDHEYYGYPKEIRSLLFRAIYYQKCVKSKKIVEETTAYYKYSLSNSAASNEMKKQYKPKENEILDEDINKFIMMMENIEGINFDKHEQKK